jgi:hypothetical protein
MIGAMLKSALAWLGWRGAVALLAIAAAAGGWMLWRVEVASHAGTKSERDTARTERDQWKATAGTRAAQLATEREQCAVDLAGEIQRGQLEAEKARRAGEAIASLTTACVQQRGPAATNRALRGVLGEQP